VVGVLVCVAFGVAYQFIDMDEVRDYAGRVNGAVAFALLVVLPLVGFPVSVLHMAAGIRFGIGWGLVLVAASIVLQLLLSYALVHLWRKRFARWLEPVRKRIPEAAHGTMCLFTMLLPGVPYFAKNYVLPLLGVPLRTYLVWCIPTHVVRSVVGVAFGDQSGHLTPTRIAVFVLYGLSVAGASWWMWRRLQSQFADRRTAAGDRKQPV
jgi:uncharacterized membrane protein YdjX (TVP38/TMEM64 family)